MAQSPSTAWRVSLARTRTDWPIVGAAWLIMVLAATLLATGPIYSSAVSVAGLQRVLADADPRAANLAVHARVATTEVGAADVAVRGVLDEALAAYHPEVFVAGRSASFALPDQPGEQVTDLTVLGFDDGLQAHADLRAGEWPSAAGRADVPVALSEESAALLGVAIGDRLRLVSRLEEALTPTVRVTGIFAITDAADPYWWQDEAVLSGVEQGEHYRTIGPLFTTPEAVAANAGGATLGVDWHAFPDFGALGVAQLGRLRAALAELPPRLEIALPEATPTLQTELGAILAASERSLLVSRTGVLLLIVQLAVLAAYAIVLTAGLLVEHRRLGTALLRSRGAGPLQVAWLSLLEGLLLAVPAALLAPWLAVGAVNLLNVAGPLAEIGLSVQPEVSLEAQLAAAAAAGACALLLVVPAFLAARSFAAEEGARSRHETRTIGQRLGIDVALLTLTVVALWQLRLYGTPLTRNVRGTLGLDPLLVAAPAIALLAGGVLALRVLPLLAVGLESLVTRGRHLVGSLGARQLSRRPLRYTRAALLLMLAISMGVFAVSYDSTWSRSQVDQSAFQVGTDIRFEPPTRRGSLPAWAVGAELGAGDEVLEAMPVSRGRVEISRSAGGGQLLALDAAAPALLDARQDLVERPWPQVLEPLAAARPELRLVTLEGPVARLRVEAAVAIDELVTPTFNAEAGRFENVPVDPAVLDGDEVLSASVVLRDGDGLLHRFRSPRVALASGPEVMDIAIASDEPLAARGPFELVGMQLHVLLPGELLAVDGRAGVIGLASNAAPEGDAWQRVVLSAAGGWRTAFVPAQGDSLDVQPDALDGLSVSLGGPITLPGQGLVGQQDSTVSYLASAVARVAADPLPAVVNQELLRRTGLTVGDELPLRVDGAARQVTIAGAIRSLPTTDPGEPALLVDGHSFALQRFASGGTPTAPDEWWLDVVDGSGPAVVERLRADPIRAEAVVARHERLATLSADPVALGIIGALSLGFVVAALFAVIGLAVSAAVLARQRRTEFALLRALGLSGPQLGRWLWLENGALALVSVAAGTLLGLAIGWVALPSVTVTQGGEPAYPPVLLQVPWLRIGLLEVVTLGALVLTVVGLAAVLRRAGIGSVLRMGED